MTPAQTEAHLAASTNVRPENRRQAARSVTECAHCFSIEHANGMVIGALLDYTPKGLGLEIFEPLEIGQNVTLRGNVEVGGVWKKVRGDARVVHCEPGGEGSFRLGLSAGDMAWLATINPDMPFLARSPRYSSG
jgi:hypothetical protein